MSAPGGIKKWRNILKLHNLSIQKRLPLMICILLLTIVICFSWTSYLGMKNASLKLGEKRVETLTQQLSSMFQQSTVDIVGATKGIALKEGVIGFLESGDIKSRNKALEALLQMRHDTLSVLVEILDAKGNQVLYSGKESLSAGADIKSTLLETAKSPISGKVGKIYLISDSMYFPIMATVENDQGLLGYIVRWRKLYATPKGMQMFSQLIGTDARMYMGNNDMKFWTDLVTPVAGPPIDGDKPAGQILKYEKTDGNRVLAAFRPIPGTDWLLLLEFSSNSFLNAANTFLYWILVIGTVLTILGIIFSWILSRKITRPLHKLTSAASSIANGNYDFRLDLDRKDELGKLARAFQAMSVQVSTSQNDLEKKVLDRTAKLEAVNSELEAFSYSVSHDLRAPLRAVNGYSVMLKEDYEAKMDDEGNRIINAIISNATMMGVLIDDLIAFSRMGRKEVARNKVDMKRLVEACVKELSEVDETIPDKIIVGNLPTAWGDHTMIKQVWMNLIGNGIKYSSKEKQPRIEVNYIQEQDRCIYFVRDNGVGFDMQYVHKLFGVFQRLHSADEFEGTGIGLALVQRIIDKHDGKVWVSAAPGEGATFFFTLSIKTTNEEY